MAGGLDGASHFGNLSGLLRVGRWRVWSVRWISDAVSSCQFPVLSWVHRLIWLARCPAVVGDAGPGPWGAGSGHGGCRFFRSRCQASL